ncbi:unnamed protein product [Victoria cruziana]
MDEPFLCNKKTADDSERQLLEFQSLDNPLHLLHSSLSRQSSLQSSSPVPWPTALPSLSPATSQTMTSIDTPARPKRIQSRSYSAPAMFTNVKTDYLGPVSHDPGVFGPSPSIVRLAFAGVLFYFSIGVVFYVFNSHKFDGTTTYRLVDALYFCVVTLCTIGYGDIVPCTNFTKLLTCIFILIGFGFIDILLTGLVSYILNRQESLLLNAMDESSRNIIFKTYVVDMSKRRMRIRMRVFLALAVVVLCIAVGTVGCRILEGLTWVDSIYLSITSVTTVGYGDYAFSTLKGRLFATVWLLVSTLAVARAFLYLAELRIDKRNRTIAKWVLQRDMTPSDLLAADLDKNGFIRVVNCLYILIFWLIWDRKFIRKCPHICLHMLHGYRGIA